MDSPMSPHHIFCGYSIFGHGWNPVELHFVGGSAKTKTKYEGLHCITMQTNAISYIFENGCNPCLYSTTLKSLTSRLFVCSISICIFNDQILRRLFVCLIPICIFRDWILFYNICMYVRLSEGRVFSCKHCQQCICECLFVALTHLVIYSIYSILLVRLSVCP